MSLKSRFHNFFAVLQRVGQSLMMPVSVLPAAGLLVALGRMVQGDDTTSAWTQALGNILFSGGLAIFEHLPAVFAIGVAIGFTGGAGVAGLAALVGYVTMENVLKVMSDALELDLAINTGVFGGILMGLIAANLYARFFRTQLHPVFGFFSGKRLVPIVTALAAIGVGIGLGFVWPPIQNGINAFGLMVMGSDLGPAFYAAGKRLLIPVGLHHVYYPPFLFEFGQYVLESGQVVRGESARYFAGDPTAGRFMASEFPIMLFGLPAAALAMVLRAKKSRRRAVAGVMLSAALTSIVTGITEPIEFTFIFVAPLLYILHVALAFVSGSLTAYFDIHLGYTFSASAIDYVLGFFNQKNSLYLWLVVGPVMAGLYFVLFYWLIKFFDFKTPGREDEDVENPEKTPQAADEKATQVLKALGGSKNISNLDACITRLRLKAKDASLVDKGRLKELGASGVMDAGGGSFQIVFGTESDILREQIQEVMDHEETTDSMVLVSPLEGEVVPLENVADKTFSDKVVGDGIAIKPKTGRLLSPIKGRVAQVFRTQHAIGLVDDQGLEILVHVGLNTVEMKGNGFTARKEKGDAVDVGDLLLEFDLKQIEAAGKDTISPIVITNMQKVTKLEVLKTSGEVSLGEPLVQLSCQESEDDK